MSKREKETEKKHEMQLGSEPAIGRSRSVQITTPVEDRRVDALARLFASKSICVAVAVIGDKLYVAANELHQTSQENRISSAITNISEYFKKLAHNIPVLDADRLQAFHEVCSSERLRFLLKGGELLISDSLPKKVIEQVLNHSKDKRTLPDAMRDEERDAPAFGLVYGCYTELYVDFKKLEDSIIYINLSSEKPEKKDKNLSLNGNQLAALAQDPIFLRNEPYSGVHAEMQILSHVISHIKRIVKENAPTDREQMENIEIYIGISKLCCLNCRCMLQTANEVLKAENIRVEFTFRGKHDLDFTKKTKGEDKISKDSWVCPKIFFDGYYYHSDIDEIPSEEGLAHRIGRLAKEKIALLMELPKPSGIRQVPDRSDSDTDSYTDRPRVDQEEELQKYKAFLERYVPEAKSAQQVLDKLLTAIKLFKIDAFNSLWQIEGSIDKSALMGKFTTIQSDYDKTQPHAPIDPAVLLAILRDSYLVGSTISRLFEKFEVPTLSPNFSSDTFPPSSHSSSQTSSPSPLFPSLFSSSSFDPPSLSHVPSTMNLSTSTTSHTSKIPSPTSSSSSSPSFGKKNREGLSKKNEESDPQSSVSAGASHKKAKVSSLTSSGSSALYVGNQTLTGSKQLQKPDIRSLIDNCNTLLNKLSEQMGLPPELADYPRRLKGYQSRYQSLTDVELRDLIGMHNQLQQQANSLQDSVSNDQ